MQHSLQCIDCGAQYSSEHIVYTCQKCDGLLNIIYDYNEIARALDVDDWFKRPFGVWRYLELIPVDASKAVSLQEGGTNLYFCQRLGKKLGLSCVYVKNEGQNPTGSFKDRGMTVGITKALELGAKTVACASTGNTSASLSAYAAKAGIRAIVFIPSGKIALGKLSQAIAHGAKIVRMRGNFDDALKAVFAFTSSNPEIYLLNSINPYRLEGQKTLAYEIFQQMHGISPDNIIVPVGNAGNISAIWKGFLDLHQLGLVKKLPRLIGIQAEGAAPLVQAYQEHLMEMEPVVQPETVATAIRIGAPVSWKKALQAVYNSKGLLETVTDREILDAQRSLAQSEGLFIEPASAASIAGLKKLVSLDEVTRNETNVCIATGHGLKDPDIIIKNYELPPELDSGQDVFEKVVLTSKVSV